VTFTPASNGLTIAAAGGGGGSNSLAVLAKATSYGSAAGDFTTPSLVTFTCTAACTYTLPSTAPTTGGYVFVQNTAPFPLTITPNGRNLDGHSESIVLAKAEGLVIVSDGSNYLSSRGTDHYSSAEQEFVLRADTCTTTGTGALGSWSPSVTNGSTAVLSGGPTWPDFCGVLMQSSATATSGAALSMGDTFQLTHYVLPALGSNAGWDATFRFSLGQTTATKMYIGFVHTSGNNASAVPTNWMGLRFDTSLGTPDSAFEFVTETAGGSISNVAYSSVDTSAHSLRIRSITAGEIRMSLDGGSEYCLTTSASSPGCAGGNVTSANVPTGDLDPVFQVANTTTTNAALTAYNMYFQARGLGR